MVKKARVLIVDDDVNFCNTLLKIMSKKGYDTTAAQSGLRALDLIKEKAFDIVFLDIIMPVMNGVETYKNIKAIRPDTTVIMMTAFSGDDLVREAIKEGVYTVLRKPFDIETAINTIEKAKDGALLVVVDDDPELCKTMQNVLEKKGYGVTTCATGEEAISLAKERPEEILFIDMKLPTLNGLETYLEIRKVNPKAIAVMMTAYRDEMDKAVKEALKNDAYTCLYKPFDMDEVTKIIEEIIQKRHKSGDNLTKKIMIVDDQQNVRTILSKILVRKGYYVIEAANGEEALKKAHKEKPDLVLLDTRMPGGPEGIEVCRQIKKEMGLDVKVIIYTGHIDAVDAVRAREAGVDDYCAKTSDFSHLLEAIEKLIK